MIGSIKFEQGDYGRRAAIVGPWSDDMSELLADSRCNDLELNDGKGWQGTDLNFLSQLPWLRSFKIIDFKISSVEPIHILHQLRALEVMTFCKTEIKFSEFPELEDCGLEWRPNATSLFGRTTLKKLFVNNYDRSNTDAFRNLIQLESLAILGAPIEDLHGLGALKHLRSLRLANLKHLASLGGIETLSNLEELEIHDCRSIRSIDEIGNLQRLRKLHLNNDGDIASLRPIARLAELQSILFYESTNIVDGDLWPLLDQKNLTRISFKNRSHYSHRREDFALRTKDIHA